MKKTLKQLEAEQKALGAKIDQAFAEMRDGLDDDDDLDPEKLKAFDSVDALKAAETEFDEAETELERLATLSSWGATRRQKAADAADAAKSRGTAADAARVGDTDEKQEKAGEKADSLEGEANAAAAEGKARGEKCIEQQKQDREDAQNEKKVSTETVRTGMKYGGGRGYFPQGGYQQYVSEVSGHSFFQDRRNRNDEFTHEYYAGDFKLVEEGGMKALLDTAGATDAGSGNERRSDDPTIRMGPMIERNLMNLIPRTPIKEGISVERRIERGTGAHAAFAAVAPGASIPERNWGLVRVKDHMEFVSAFQPISLRDLAGDSTVYDGALERCLRTLDRRWERYLARGTGTNPAIKGLLGYVTGATNNWGIGAVAKDGQDSIWQYLIKTFWDLCEEPEDENTLAGWKPNAIVISSKAMGRILTETGVNLELQTATANVDTVVERSDHRAQYTELMTMFGKEISPFAVSDSLASDKSTALMGNFMQSEFFEYGEMEQRLDPAVNYDPTATAEGIAPPANARNLIVGSHGCLLVYHGTAFKRMDLY